MAHVRNANGSKDVVESIVSGFRRTRLKPLRRRGRLIDPASFGLDDFLTLPVAARLAEMTVNGHPKNPSQVYRLVANGVLGIRLRTTLQGVRKRVTTRRWIREFLDAVAAADRERPLAQVNIAGLAVRRRNERSRWLSAAQATEADSPPTHAQ